MIVSTLPSQSTILTALRSFLLGIVPSGTEVLQAQTNRVPETKAPNFVLMTPIRRDRIETNVDSSGDVFFTGSFDDETTLTVTEVSYGTIIVGSQVFGPTISASLVVQEQLSGDPGGIGTYSVSDPPGEVASGPLAAGVSRLMQPTKFLIQLDVHGPQSGDTAQTISTYFRDIAGFDAMQALNANVSPLYADDPRQMPFVNENQQIENRWVIEAFVQVNITVIISQQYADTVSVLLIDVDATYPP